MHILSQKDIHLFSDAELAKKYLSSGDKHYFGELFKRYTHLVFGVCMKYLQNEAKSQDAVMDIFEDLILKLRHHHVNNFKNWLYSVAKNHCLMLLRKEKQEMQKTKKMKEATVISMEFIPVLHQDNETITDHHLNFLEQGIKQLSKEQRECINLFYLKQKCYKEVAEVTSYSLKEIKSYIQNGKRNLKKILLNINEQEAT